MSSFQIQHVTCDNETITGTEIYVKGNNNTVTGYFCKVTGDSNRVSGSNDVRGNRNIVEGVACVVRGDGNMVSGEEAKVVGDFNTVIGNGADVRGKNNSVRGNDCEVWGVDNDVVGHRNTLNGKPVYRYVDEEEEEEEEERERSVKRVKTIHIPSADHEDKPASNKACVVCLVNEPLCAALPCGHLAFCVACSRSLVLDAGTSSKRQDGGGLDVVCPICRTKVDEFKYMHTC